LIILFTLGILVFANQAPAHAILNHLIISEVYYDTAAGRDNYEEWVELYNPLLGAVDLTSWFLLDNASSFPLSGSIQPKDFFIVAKDNKAFYDLYGFYPDLSGSSLRLSNSGDFVLLKQNTSEIDAVGYEGGSSGDNGRFDDWHIFAGDQKSIMRKSLTLDTDTPDDWLVDTTPNPGTGPTTPVSEPSTLILLSIGLSTLGLFVKKEMDKPYSFVFFQK
jgi:hypothetical protein